MIKVGTKTTRNQINQRGKDIYIYICIYIHIEKSIATVTIKAMIKEKNKKKLLKNAKFTGARTEQHTHTQTRPIK